MSLGREEDKYIIYNAKGITLSSISRWVSGEINEKITKGVIREWKPKRELLVDVVRDMFERA